MKKVGVVVLVVVLLVLALPPVLGSRMEARLRNDLERADQTPMVTARLRSYDRGWFRSHAIIDVGLDPDYVAQLSAGMPEPLPFDGTLSIVTDIAHGPVAVLDGVYFGLATAVGHLDASASGIAELQQRLGVPYVFRWRNRVAFTGAASFDAEVPPFTFPVEDSTLQFSGLSVDGTLRGAHLISNARADSMEFTGPMGAFAMRNLRTQGDNEFVGKPELFSQYILPGTATLSIEQISLTQGPQNIPVFEATNARFESEMTLNADETMADVRVIYGLDSAVAGGVRVADGALGFVVRNVDLAILNAYLEAAQSSSTDPEAFLAEAGPLLARGLAAGPTFAFDPIRFELDDEPLDARVEISVNPDALPPAGAFDMNDPTLWMTAANTNASVTLSKKLAERLAALALQAQLGMQYGGDPNMPPEQLKYMAEAQAGLILVQLAGQGILTDAGDSYRSELSVANGTMTLNGNPLPFGLP